MRIRDAIIAYLDTISTDKFYSIDMVAYVRRYLMRPLLMDGSIMRELRKMRELGLINYIVLDQHKSYYKITDRRM